MIKSKIRLFLEHQLSDGNSVVLSRKQANYIFNVMRLNTGDELRIFNSSDGEWLSTVQEKSKTSGVLLCLKKLAVSFKPSDIWFIFAPIKKTRTDFIVEKVTEMGASKIVPVITDHSNTGRISRDRLQAHAIEAAEQCGTNFVPKVSELKKLSDILASWSRSRTIWFCDETKQNINNFEMIKTKGPSAILIGPEGGFSERERCSLLAKEFVHSISLGPRILRADTAAVVALTLWQLNNGDW